MFGGQGKVNSPSCSITQSEPRRDQEKSSNISGAFKSCGIPKTMAFNTKKLILDDLGCMYPHFRKLPYQMSHVIFWLMG